jgi:Putative Zn-dependent protease, contains TPR repeats
MLIQFESFNSYSQKWVVLFAAIVLASLCSVTPVTAQNESGSADEAVAVFNQGQDAHEKGDLASAIDYYEKALKILPEFPEAEFQLGNAQLSLGKTVEAEKAFRKCVELKPEWSLAVAKLGETLVNKFTHLHGRDAKVSQAVYTEATQVLGKAINLDSGNFPAYVALTDLLLHSSPSANELRAMLTRLKSLTDGKMNAPASIWTARGEVENALGDRLSAKSSLGHAVEINPKETSAVFALADIALSESDSARASDLVKLLGTLSKDPEGVAVMKARLAVVNGKPADALRLLDAIAQPSAETLALREKIVSAESTDTAALEKQLEANPKNAAVLGRLCSLYRTTNPAKSLDYCRRASEAEPENVRHAIGYGAALVQAKRYDEAVSLFQKLLKFEPSNATIHANLATALFQLKRLPEAKEEYLWLIQNEPQSAIAYYFLAIAHDQLREYTDAMANYQQFLRLANADESKLEIEKVNLRLPTLQKLIKEKGEKKNE